MKEARPPFKDSSEMRSVAKVSAEHIRLTIEAYKKKLAGAAYDFSAAEQKILSIAENNITSALEFATDIFETRDLHEALYKQASFLRAQMQFLTEVKYTNQLHYLDIHAPLYPSIESQHIDKLIDELLLNGLIVPTGKPPDYTPAAATQQTGLPVSAIPPQNTLERPHVSERAAEIEALSSLLDYANDLVSEARKSIDLTFGEIEK